VLPELRYSVPNGKRYDKEEFTVLQAQRFPTNGDSLRYIMSGTALCVRCS
jgi:hypothetical protein